MVQVVRNNQVTLMPWHCGNFKMTTVYNVLCGDNKPHKHDALEDTDKLRAIYSQIRGKIKRQTFETSVFSFPAEEDEVCIPATRSMQQQPHGTVKRRSIEGDHEEQQATNSKRPCHNI